MVGLTPLAPAFARILLAPKIALAVGPRAVSAEFISPRGAILSSWRVSDTGDTVELNATVPVGVVGTITVPKPFEPTTGNPTATAVVIESGVRVWDGHALIGTTAGIVSAQNTPGGVAFEVLSGAYEFRSGNPGTQLVAGDPPRHGKDHGETVLYKSP